MRKRKMWKIYTAVGGLIYEVFEGAVLKNGSEIERILQEQI